MTPMRRQYTPMLISTKHSNSYARLFAHLLIYSGEKQVPKIGDIIWRYVHYLMIHVGEADMRVVSFRMKMNEPYSQSLTSIICRHFRTSSYWWPFTAKKLAKYFARRLDFEILVLVKSALLDMASRRISMREVGHQSMAAARSHFGGLLERPYEVGENFAAWMKRLSMLLKALPFIPCLSHIDSEINTSWKRFDYLRRDNFYK